MQVNERLIYTAKPTIWFLGLALLFIAINAYFRFSHQDPGWYYALAERIAKSFGLNDSVSSWSFVDANGDKGVGGVIFILLQFLTIIIFPADLLGIKILNAVIAFFTFLLFHRLVMFRLKVKSPWLAVLLLLFSPYFVFHIMNRPEMLACLVAVGVWYLLSDKYVSNRRVFFSYFISAFLLDIHPISVFLVVGITVIWFFTNLRRWYIAVGGAVAGLVFITGLNYLLTGGFGIFQFFFDSTTYMNDHYFPIFVDPAWIILTRPVVKLRFLAAPLMAGLLLALVAWVWFRNSSLVREIFHRNKLLIWNAIIFFFLSNLFSEGGNGYSMYSLVCYTSMIILLYDVIIRHFGSRGALLYMIPLLYFSYGNLAALTRWVNYDRYFNKEYFEVDDKIAGNHKLLIRPTFSFALNERKVHCEPLYPVLMYMYKSKQSFGEALETKGYDLVAVDEMFLHDVDPRYPITPYSYGDFYKKVDSVRFSPVLLDSMARAGVFDTIIHFKDFYHGNTYFLKINKNNLHQFNNKLSNE